MATEFPEKPMTTDEAFGLLVVELMGSHQPPSYQDFLASLDACERTMEDESDRGCLLVGLALIDDRLGKSLKQILSILDSKPDAVWLLDPAAGNRPLGTLAVRTRIGKCLGLVDDQMRNVIDALRKLRNSHAHGTASFVLKDAEIEPVVGKWNKANLAVMEAMIKSSSHRPKWTQMTSARQRLATTVSMVAIFIEWLCNSRTEEYSEMLLRDQYTSARTAVDSAFLTKPASSPGRLRSTEKKPPPKRPPG